MDFFVTNTSQFFSYYPKYEYLDGVLSSTNRKRINLFIDTKSCGQSLFQEWAIKYILENSKSSPTLDTSLFSSVLEFISFHKQYAKKRQADIYFYFFMEQGKSTYHLDLLKTYKSHRGSSDMFGLDLASRELYFQILDKNYIVLDKVINKLPRCSFIKLNYLEADYIPYYLMKHVLSREVVDQSANIVYSTDKDMLQCLDASNIFQFFKHYKSVKMLNYKDIYSHWLKTDLEVNDPALWFPLALSIIGDSGDEFDGVKGIGPVSLVNNFSYIMSLCNHSMDLVYKNILEKKPIFDINYKPINKSMKLVFDSQDIIIRNLKLSSYKLLSDCVNSGFPLYMTDRKKQIIDSVNSENKCTGAGILISALNKNGLMGILKESTVGDLF